jgi:hypothetical protein
LRRQPRPMTLHLAWWHRASSRIGRNWPVYIAETGTMGMPLHDSATDVMPEPPMSTQMSN